MRTGLDHLPQIKRRELAYVARVLFEAFDAAHALGSQAYVNARYSPHYEISDAELEWLGARVADLQAIVGLVCEERLGEG